MRGPATLLWDIYENCPTPGWLDCSEPSSGCSVMWWWRTGGWESNLYKPQIFYPAVKLLSAITMITMITFLLVVSTTSSVLSYSDFTLDRYREQDQTIRHGKSKFINLQPLTVSSSQCFHRSSNVSTSHKREEQPRLRGRGMFRIKKFKSRGNFRAVEKKYPLQFENYKSVTGKCRIVFCKNIYSAKLCVQKYK